MSEFKKSKLLNKKVSVFITINGYIYGIFQHYLNNIWMYDINQKRYNNREFKKQNPRDDCEHFCAYSKELRKDEKFVYVKM